MFLILSMFYCIRLHKYSQDFIFQKDKGLKKTFSYSLAVGLSNKVVCSLTFKFLNA